MTGQTFDSATAIGYLASYLASGLVVGFLMCVIVGWVQHR